MESAIYRGTLRHRRFEPVRHEFSYTMFMLYLDLSELDRVFEGSRLFSARGRAIAEFRRSDHMGDPDAPLEESVRSLVKSRTGHRPLGPIRLLTHLRYFGYIFNPVSFYYCFDEEGIQIEYVVAEVNNTPWGERHCYVLAAGQSAAPKGSGGDGILKFSPEKAMHVSPFMPMDVAYDWRMGTPGDNLNVLMMNTMADRRVFAANLRLERQEITAAALARVLLEFPLMTVKVITAIHWQALRLWLKRCPFYPHPAGPHRNVLMDDRAQ
jgi:DUF1365 family protein